MQKCGFEDEKIGSFIIENRPRCPLRKMGRLIQLLRRWNEVEGAPIAVIPKHTRRAAYANSGGGAQREGHDLRAGVNWPDCANWKSLDSLREVTFRWRNVKTKRGDLCIMKGTDGRP